MKTNRARLRRVARWMLLLGFFGVAIVLVLPLWLPWVLRPALTHYGLRYEGYSRIGYSRFTIRNLTGEWQNARFRADSIECLQPTGWVWRRIFRGTNGDPGLIINGAHLLIQRNTNAAFRVEDVKPSFSGTLDRIARIGMTLRRELPATQLTNCVIEFDSMKVMLPGAAWRAGNLRAGAWTGSFTNAINVVAGFESRSSLSLAVLCDSPHIGIQGHFEADPDGWRLTGGVTWLTNRAVLFAQFSTNSGWWPVQAQLEGQQLHVPAKLIGLKDYRDPTATLALNVSSNRFEIQAASQAIPDRGVSNSLPPMEAMLRAHGDLESVTLDRLYVQTPWLHAELTNPIGIKRTGELLTNIAQLEISLNLTNVPKASLSGHANGLVTVELNAERQPVAKFHLTGSDIRAPKLDTDYIRVNGQFTWPILTLDEFAAGSSDGSTIQTGGSLDVSSHQLQANWRVKGNFLQKLIPGLSYDQLDASGTVQGPLTAPVHSGEIAIVNLHADAFKPLAVKSEWRGEKLRFPSAIVKVSAGDSEFEINGELDLAAIKRGEITGTVQEATLRREGQTLYALQQSSRITVRRGDEKQQRWEFQVDPLDFRGGERSLSLEGDLDWPLRGEVSVKATKFELDDFKNFSKANIGGVSIGDLTLTANWSNGPVRAVMTADVSVNDQQGRKSGVKGSFNLGEALEIQELTLNSELSPILTLKGILPLQIVPGHAGSWLITDGQRPLTLQADSQSVKEFTLPLGALGKIQISQPVLQSRTSGTIEKPSATLTVSAASIDWQSPTNTIARPQLEQLELDIRVSPELMELRRFSALIDDQPIEASGEWPLSSGFWQQLWSKKIPPDWTKARGRLRIESAEVAVLSHYLPGLLAPEGQLKLDVALVPGGKLDGQLVLTNAATRSLGNITPMRDIAGLVRLEGQRAILEELHGQIGGQPVQASGSVIIPVEGDLDYQLRLRGSNVPLARSLEFLLRSDINVQLRGGNTEPTTLTGDVTLHDGLYVQHASALMWSRPKRPELKPPYFSVTNEPFGDWKLDLNVRGDRFLQVRTPVFIGVISANAKVQGMFRVPLTTGDARVTSGRVLFPFGTLRIEHAYASLSGNDPRGPDLQISASGRTLNYEVRLEIKGPADRANVTFSSTPPLNSEEILLMLTAGELPRQEYIFSTEDKAGRLASFLGKDVVSRFTGSDSTEERLVINSGENISDEGKLTYSVEYLFSKRWSIIGEYDRFGAFNADLKWKILSR